MHRNVMTIAFLITVFLISGCTTTQITSFWKDPGYRHTPHKLLVIALIKDKGKRLAVEDEFARQLDTLGLDVTSGSRAFPVDTPDNKKELERYLRDHGYDSFLLLRVVAEKDLLSNVPASATLPDTYSTTDGATPPPGSVVEQRVAMAEANLYDVATQKLFWTAATRTTFEKVSHKLITDYVTQIVKKMQQSELLQ